MAMIRKGILNSQKTPEPIDLDSKIYGVDGLPTKSEHMPNLNVVRTDDAVGMTPADFHNVFPFNEIINENVPNFVEYGRWDANYNTFDSQGHMVGDLSSSSYAFYEHLYAGDNYNAKPAHEWFGHATKCKIYVKDPNNRYKYVLPTAGALQVGNTYISKPTDFENCVYYMNNMDAYLQEMMEGMDTSYIYPVVRYGFLFIIIPMTAVVGYIYHNGTEWVRIESAAAHMQPMDDTIPKQEITTSSIFKTLDDNKYWRYNGGTSYTIADFDEIPIPLTPTKRIPKFYVKRGMNPDGTWFEKISKTKHDETWLCHKAFISDNDELEKPYLYVASEIVTSSYRDLREDRGNFKVYGETDYDMFETLFRIAYASWMSTYDEDNTWVIADLREFGIPYLDCVLRVDTKYEENIGTSLDGVGFGRPFGIHYDPFGTDNDIAVRMSNISTFRNAKGEGASSLRIPDNAPADGALYHFNEIEINGNDIFKYVNIVNGHDDSNPVIRQSVNEYLGPDWGFDSYQALRNDVGIFPTGERTTIFDENVSFEGEVEGLSLYSGDGVDELYDLLAGGGVIEGMPVNITMNDTEYEATYVGVSTEDLPNAAYVVVDQGYNPFLVVLDSIDLGMPLGKVIAFVGNALEYNGIENLNYLKIEADEVLTIRDFEYMFRTGSIWRLLYSVTQNPAFLEKKGSINPTVMELETYTKTNNNSWFVGWNGDYQQPNHVGIGTGIRGFLEYLYMLLLSIQFANNLNYLLRTKFLNADFFAYEVLLQPVKTRLVMLP